MDNGLAATVSGIESRFAGLPVHSFSSFHMLVGTQHTAVAYGFGSPANMTRALSIIKAEEAGLISSDEVYRKFPRTMFIAVNVGYECVAEALHAAGEPLRSDIHVPSQDIDLFAPGNDLLYPEYDVLSRVPYEMLPVSSGVKLLRPGLEDAIMYVTLELCRGTGRMPTGIDDTDAILSVSISRQGKVFRVSRFDRRRAPSLKPRLGEDAFKTIESFASYIARNERRKGR